MHQLDDTLSEALRLLEAAASYDGSHKLYEQDLVEWRRLQLAAGAARAAANIIKQHYDPEIRNSESDQRFLADLKRRAGRLRHLQPMDDGQSQSASLPHLRVGNQGM
jgi:hypothetical protein